MTLSYSLDLHSLSSAYAAGRLSPERVMDDVHAAIKDFFAVHSGEMDPVVRQIIGGAQKFSAVDAFEAAYALEALRKRCNAAWRQMDVLAVPEERAPAPHDSMATGKIGPTPIDPPS